jgi:membrane-bound lytic murein transglycosylase D
MKKLSATDAIAPTLDQARRKSLWARLTGFFDSREDSRTINNTSIPADDSANSTPLTVGDMVFEMNPAIERWVNYYTESQRGRQTLQIGISRSISYLNLARVEFRRMGLPQDLVWLAQVESVWHASAVSPAAAGGLWQFIRATAEDYGLNVSEEQDERLDPAKQTKVAAAYLRDLYTIFGDWALAMAAYNCGEPRVMGAIVKNGRADFWEIRQKKLLPQETLNYVPKILAAIAVTSQAENYGFSSDAQVEAAGEGR